MIRIPARVALGFAAALALAAPIAASAHDGQPVVTYPLPQAILRSALDSLNAHDTQGATAKIEQAEDRLLTNQIAEGGMAIPEGTMEQLDHARQALAHGDVGAATRSVTDAEATL